MKFKKWLLIRAFDVKKFFSDAKAKRIMKKAKAAESENPGYDFPPDNKTILCIALHSIITDNIVKF